MCSMYSYDFQLKSKKKNSPFDSLVRVLKTSVSKILLVVVVVDFQTVVLTNSCRVNFTCKHSN